MAASCERIPAAAGKHDRSLAQLTQSLFQVPTRIASPDLSGKTKRQKCTMDVELAGGGKPDQRAGFPLGRARLQWAGKDQSIPMPSSS